MVGSSSFVNELCAHWFSVSKKKVFYYLHFIFVFFQRQRILDLVYFQTRLTLYAFSMNWGPFFVCMHFYVYMIEILAVV